MMIEFEDKLIKYFYETADLILIMLDKDGKVLYLNEKGSQKIEYELDELKGTDWFIKCVPKEEHEAVRYVFNATINGLAHKFEHFESSVLTKSGNKLLISWVYRLIVDETSSCYVVCIGRDVTKYNTLIDSLLNEELRLKKLLSTITGFIFTADTFVDTRKVLYHSFNPGCYEVTGFSEEVFSEDPFFWEKIIYPNDLEVLNKYLEKMFHGETMVTVEHRIICKNGEVRWVSNMAILLEGIKGGYRYNVLISDITEKKRVSEELQESRIKLQIFTDAAFEAILILENDVIIDMNEQALLMFKYKKEEMLGQKFTDFLTEEAKNLLQSDNPDTIEIDAFRSNSQLFPCEVRMRFLKSLEKRLKILVIRDLTEKKDAEKKLFNTIIEVEERERQKFSRELHDGLGPILSSIKLYLNLMSELKDESRLNEIYGKTLECLNEAIRSLKEISSNLSPSSLTKYGLVYAIRSFIERFSLNHHNSLKIEFTFNKDRRYERNIEVSIYRIISELINNTIKHANATKITINLCYSEEEKTLKLNYTDNGSGMDVAKELKRAAGLGLSNIYQRVEFLKGTISFNSILDRGIKVEITLPVN